MTAPTKQNQEKIAMRASQVPARTSATFALPDKQEFEMANPVHILPLVKDERLCYYPLLDDDKVVQLRNFIRFHKKNASDLSSSFLSSALQELIMSRREDPSLKDLVLNTFDQELLNFPIGALVKIFKHAELQPPVHLFMVEPQWRYWRIPRPEYFGHVGNDAVSSLEIYRFSQREYFVYLFEHDGYQGRFINFSGDAHETVRYVGDPFNDMTSSILVVQSAKNHKSLPIQLFRPAIQNVISSALSNRVGIRQNGDVVISWTMWPGFASNETFIKIEQPVEITVDMDSVIKFPSKIFGIDLPDWPSKYNASIIYYIGLSVVSGTLTGRIMFYNAIVESGIFQGEIRSNLMPEVASNISMVDTFLNENLRGFKNLQSVYLLPGNSLVDGDTRDGVIVRLVPN